MIDQETPLPPSKVLIVDDNAQNLELLAAYMEEVPNITAIAAYNGIEAMQKVAQENPDEFERIETQIDSARKNHIEVTG